MLPHQLTSFRTSVTSPASGRGGDHRRAHQQRSAGRTSLPALEVAVRRRRAHLIAFELVRVHAQAHRAAGAAPLEARRAEDLVQPFALGRAG